MSRKIFSHKKIEHRWLDG